MTSSTLGDRLLVEALDDWLHLADVAWAARQFARSEGKQDVVAAATQALAALLHDDLIQIGEVSDGGFFAWDVPPDEAIARVGRDWLALNRHPQPGDVCWLANTAKGRAHAEALIARQSSERKP
jgi:hypothetical protein